MSKLFHIIKHEFFEVLPPTIFFFLSFNLIAITRALMLKEHGIELVAFGGATLGALIVGKVVLIADKLPFINKFPDRPLIYNVAWKTIIYIVAAFLVRFLEHFLPLVSQHGGGRSRVPASLEGDFLAPFLGRSDLVIGSLSCLYRIA